MKNIVLAVLMAVLPAVGVCRDGQVDLLNHSASVFNRESAAYLDGASYDTDVKRTMSRVIPGEVILTLPALEPVTAVGDIKLGYTIAHDGMLYAFQYNTAATGKGLYKSSDGITWTQVVSAANLTSANKLFSSLTGTLFLTYSTSLYRSVTNGSNFTDVLLSTLKVLDFSAGSTPDVWNYYQRENGDIIFGEYSATGPSGKLYMSKDGDDGAVDTWGVIYNSSDEHADYISSAVLGIKHSHRIAYHSETGIWLCSFGDGSGINYTAYSDTNGGTWLELFKQGQGHFQPVEYYDYGDATKLLYGGDQPGAVGTVDVVTGERNILYSGQNSIWVASISPYQYCFAIGKYGSVYLFSMYEMSTVTAANRKASIVASTDLINFYPIAHFPNNDCGVIKFLGLFGGKYHFCYQDANAGFRHGYMTIPSFKTVTGLAIDPGTTNVMTANVSSAETSKDAGYSQNVAAWATVTQSNEQALHGTYSVKYSGITNAHSATYSTLPAYTTAANLAEGDKCSMQFSVKSAEYLPLSVRWYGSGGTPSPAASNIYFGAGSSWKTYFTHPFTAPAGVSYVRGELYPSSVTFTCTFSDSTEYVTGGSSTTALMENEAVKFSATTTMPTYATATPFVDGTTYYAVSVDNANKRFKVSLTSGGDPLDIDGAGTGTIYFCRAEATGYTNGYYVDCYQVEEGPPTRWHIGAGTRAYESLTNTISFDEIWTNKITYSPYPPFYAFNAAFGAQYIKSWYLDASNYIELYWSATDYKYYISVVNAGGAAETYASVKTYKPYADDIIKLALIYDGSLLSLHIDFAGIREIVSCTTSYTWMRRLTGTKTGNYAGNAVMSMTLLEDYYYPNRISLLSDKQVDDTTIKNISGGKSTVYGSGGTVYGH